jgi:hypothetical protein
MPCRPRLEDIRAGIAALQEYAATTRGVVLATRWCQLRSERS